MASKDLLCARNLWHTADGCRSLCATQTPYMTFGMSREHARGGARGQEDSVDMVVLLRGEGNEIARIASFPGFLKNALFLEQGFGTGLAATLRHVFARSVPRVAGSDLRTPTLLDVWCRLGHAPRNGIGIGCQLSK